MIRQLLIGLLVGITPLLAGSTAINQSAAQVLTQEQIDKAMQVYKKLPQSNQAEIDHAVTGGPYRSCTPAELEAVKAGNTSVHFTSLCVLHELDESCIQCADAARPKDIARSVINLPQGLLAQAAKPIFQAYGDGHAIPARYTQFFQQLQDAEQKQFVAQLVPAVEAFIQAMRQIIPDDAAFVKKYNLGKSPFLYVNKDARRFEEAQTPAQALSGLIAVAGLAQEYDSAYNPGLVADMPGTGILLSTLPSQVDYWIDELKNALPAYAGILMSQQEITDALQQAVDLSKLVAVAQQSVGEKAAVITKIFKQYEKQIAVWAAAGNVRSAAE
jgi:hypothetical protein